MQKQIARQNIFHIRKVKQRDYKGRKMEPRVRKSHKVHTMKFYMHLLIRAKNNFDFKLPGNLKKR